MDAVLLFNGEAVRTKSDQYDFSNEDNYVLSSNGYLRRFKIREEEYELYTKADFLKEHRDTGFYRTGYYKKESFLRYKKDAGKSNSNPIKMTLKILKNEVFPIIQSYTKTGWGFEYAKEGDRVKVEVLYQTIFSHYFNIRIYTFIIPSNYEYKKYKKIDDLPNATFTDHSRPFSERGTGRFYTKNFGGLLNSQPWSDLEDSIPEDYVIVDFDNNKPSIIASKTLYAKTMCQICFKIYHIHKDLLKKLAIANLGVIKTAVWHKYHPTNPNNSQYDGLPLIDQVLGELMKDWGFLYNDNPSIDASQILPETPNYREFVRYRKVLANLKQNLKFLDEDIVFPTTVNGTLVTQVEDSNRRIKFLHTSLISSLAILSIEQKIKMLESFIDKASKKGDIEKNDDEEIDEVDILNLLASVTAVSSDANKLLDFLLKERTDEGKIKTNFEILYYLMDDSRLDRIFIIQIFVTGDNNRQHFINALYRIWKVSQYNYSFVPGGITPNEDNMNPNSFFLDESNEGGYKYFPKYDVDGILIDGSDPVLEFETIKIHENLYGTTNKSIKYSPQKELDKEVIILEKKIHDPSAYPNFFTKSKYGEYHIYQPISLIGYEADLELSVPSKDPIPAFLFFYAEEFDRLKDIDAAISFGVEGIVEIGLFFLTGGLGAIRHLKHLKSITKLRHLSIVNNEIKWAVTSTEKILFWRGLESTAEVVSVTAGMLTSFFNYQKTTTNNQDLKELNRKLSNFFLVLTLCSAGKAIISRSKAVKSADDVLKKIDDLSDLGISHGVPDNILDVISTIRNTAKVSRTLFRNRIASLVQIELGEANHIIEIFDNLSDVNKSNFWIHFGDKIKDTPENLNFWKQMNKSEGTISAARMNAWINTPYKFRFLRRELTFLDEVVKLAITDRKAYEHIAEFALRPTSGKSSSFFKVTGGHKFRLTLDGSSPFIVVDNNFKILDPNFTHIIGDNTSQIMKNYLNALGDLNLKGYKKVNKANGHVIHHNLLIEVVPQPSLSNIEGRFVLNGIVYKRFKSQHTQLNVKWTESDIIYEYAFALKNKKIMPLETVIKPANTPNGNHGLARRLVETVYISRLLDGTKIKIKHQDFFRYNQQPIFEDHYHYFELEL